ncbi:hypothetical protein V1291_002043 [Nitrobacteraceae bacterium AZCC 1564]
MQAFVVAAHTFLKGNMTKSLPRRGAFRDWIDSQKDPKWKLLPLTHITKGVTAHDIIDTGSIEPTQCEVFNEPLAYFFYGRPAYRIGGDGAVKVEASCPYCFIFDSALIDKAKGIYAFDTGAFQNRLYKHYLSEEMNARDFSLGNDTSRPNKIIAKTFGSQISYFDGDLTKVVSADNGADPWEFHARAYLNLLKSPGRNEPDDRICSIEIVLGEPVPLSGNLNAVVVPHTLWDKTKKAPWLKDLSDQGVEILPYLFVPGRHPEHYHALLEVAVRKRYEEQGTFDGQ